MAETANDDEVTDGAVPETGDNPLSRVTDPTFSFRTRAVPIRLFVRAARATWLDEARVCFGRRQSAVWNKEEEVDGIHVHAVDPANVAMTLVELPASSDAIRDWNVPTEDTPYHKVGMPISDWHKRLKFARMTGSGVPDDGDPLSIRFDAGDDLLDTQVTRPGERTQRVTTQHTIDPDSIRQEPDVPDHLEMEHKGLVDSARSFKDAVDALDDTADHVEMRVDPDEDDAWQIHATNDAISVRSDFVRFKDAHEPINEGGYDPDASSLFSMDYLEDISQALKRARMDKVTVRWGNELPVVVRAWNTDYGIRATYLLAPRIQKDD